MLAAVSEHVTGLENPKISTIYMPLLSVVAVVLVTGSTDREFSANAENVILMSDIGAFVTTSDTTPVITNVRSPSIAASLSPRNAMLHEADIAANNVRTNIFLNVFIIFPVL